MADKKFNEEWGGILKLLIHDLSKEDSINFIGNEEDVMVICDEGTIQNCIGCFGCWIKTPGQCVISDEYSSMGENISKCNEVIIISKCFYGGYSPFVKNVMDRSISYIHPYFEIYSPILLNSSSITHRPGVFIQQPKHPIQV